MFDAIVITFNVDMHTTIFSSSFFLQFNMGIRASLRASRLISRALKLTIM